MSKTVIVIGGGAAGFFSALNCAAVRPDYKIHLLEKSSKLLSKVRISGGGRCNVTHACYDAKELLNNYPRGHKSMAGPFKRFGTSDTVAWFEQRGVKLKTEADGRMFPITDNSETIINCFLNEAQKAEIKISMNADVVEITKDRKGTFILSLRDGNTLTCDKLLIATGGNPKKEAYEWIRQHELEIESPVPSLFTFNIADPGLRQLMGVSVPNAKIKILGSKLNSEGPLLITHWGMSGPAILKLSAFAARYLNDLDYKFSIAVNWIPEVGEEALRELLNRYRKEHASKFIHSIAPFDFPSRLWKFLISRKVIDENLRWGDVSNKIINQLVAVLATDLYEVNGKTTFKEEFVTCGGVSLDDINLRTMESKKTPNLFFAGEVLDVDGITGGFNFQSAWTTGWIAAMAIAEIEG